MLSDQDMQVSRHTHTHTHTHTPSLYSLRHTFHPPWCRLEVRFDSIERRVGVYIPLRAPTVAAEVCGWDSTQDDNHNTATTKFTHCKFSRQNPNNIA